MTKFLRAFFLFLSFALIQGCSDSNGAFSNETQTTLKSINIEFIDFQVGGSLNTTLPVGLSAQLRATGQYSDGKKIDITELVSWSINSPEAGSINTNGLFTALSEGEAVITASLEGITSNNQNVLITNATILSIQVTPVEFNVPQGLTQQMTAIAQLSDRTSYNVTNYVTWQVASGQEYVTVDATGLLNAVSVGSASVSATLLDVTSNVAEVQITDAEISAIQITPATVSLAKGLSQPMTAMALLTDNRSYDVTSNVNWSIKTGQETVSINQAGELVATNVGNATISATLQNIESNTASIEVKDAEIVSITVTPPSLELAKGLTQQMTAIAKLSDRTSFDVTNDVAWQVASGQEYVTVDASGLLSAISAGSASVSASLLDVTSNVAEIQVTDAEISAIQITPATVSLAKGLSQPMTAMALLTDNRSYDVTSNVNWSIKTGQETVSINQAGELVATNVGNATISATLQNIESNTASIEVKDAEIVSITVTPPSLELAKGLTQQMTAIAKLSDRTSFDVTNDVAWQVASGQEYVTVDASGLLSAISAGSASVSASLLDVTSNVAEIQVTDAEISAIQITPATVSLVKGLSQPMTAMALLTDNRSYDVTSNVNWSIKTGQETVSINQAGELVATNVGNATISATLQNIESNTASIEVKDAEIVSITVTPPSLELAKGLTQQMTAIAKLSDRTSFDVTNDVAWQVASGQEYVTVDASGLLSAISAGSASVSASLLDVTSNVAEIQVTDAEISAIQITPATVSLVKGLSQPMTAMALLTDNRSYDVTSNVNWSIKTGQETVSINQAGELVATNVGNATISATLQNIESNTASIEVKDAEIVSITVTPPSLELAKGLTQQMTAIAKLSDRTSFDVTNDVAWQVASGQEYVTVDASGLLSAISAGSASVSASLLDVTSNVAEIQVTDAEISAIQITPATVSLVKGLSQPMTAMALLTDNRSYDVTSNVNWSIKTGQETVSINQAGELVATNVGNATISATLQNIESNTASIEVKDAEIVSITVTPPSLELAKGLTQQMTAIAKLSDNSKIDVTKFVTWIPDGGDNVTIEQGELVAVQVGQVKVSASLNNVTSNSASITVTDATILSLRVSPSMASLPKGVTQQMNVVAFLTDSSTFDVTEYVNWEFSEPNIISIERDGTLTGTNVGTVTVSAELQSVRSNNSASIEITAASLLSIEVSPSPIELPIGITQQMTASGIYSDGERVPLTTDVFWYIESNTFATITDDGNIEGIALGSTSVIAFKDGVVSSPVPLTITDATLQSITIAPLETGEIDARPLEVYQNVPAKLIALGRYSDGSEQDVTADVQWNSKNPEFIDLVEGKLTYVSTGTADVYASLDNIDSNDLTLDAYQFRLTFYLSSDEDNLSKFAYYLNNVLVSPGLLDASPNTDYIYSLTDEDITEIRPTFNLSAPLNNIAAARRTTDALILTELPINADDISGHIRGYFKNLNVINGTIPYALLSPESPMSALTVQGVIDVYSSLLVTEEADSDKTYTLSYKYSTSGDYQLVNPNAYVPKGNRIVYDRMFYNSSDGSVDFSVVSEDGTVSVDCGTILPSGEESDNGLFFTIPTVNFVFDGTTCQREN